MAEDAVEQAAQELYGLPLGDFTRARDERAKALRTGDRKAANAIKGLRKPTLAAWALNQLVRRRRADVERLLAAGVELRAAQEELIGGGDRAAFQHAAAAERELVSELSAAATALASEVGRQGAGLREKLGETLHAAALDEETAAELGAGRLLREREAIGGFGFAGAAAPPEPAAAAPAPPVRATRTARKGKKTSSRPATERERGDQRLAAAQADEREARRDLGAAERDVQQAALRAEAARTRAEAAEGHARDLAQRAQVAEERAREAAERAEEAERLAGDARRAEKQARKAHQRADKALKSADRRAG